MIQDLNRMLGGMNKDSHPNNQPENSIRHALNFVPMSKDGNIYSVTNEDGTKRLSNVALPANHQIIGHTILDSDIILVMVNPDTGASHVGYIREDGTTGSYHVSGPVDASGTPLIDNNELGFSIDHPVDCVARKLIDGHRILYFTDNNNPFGRFDLDDPPAEGTVGREVGLIFSQTVPTIVVDSIQENVKASLKPGVVQFITRYVTKAGDVTNFGLPSNPFPIIPAFKTEGVDNYKGGANDSGDVNKSLLLKISDIDTVYNELEIIAIYYEDDNTIPIASRVARLPITSDSTTFNYVGPDTENLIDISPEELVKTQISYKTAKCIEQKDNRLFLSNLTSDRGSDDELMQSIANDVTVSYTVDSMLFSNRGSVVTNTVTDSFEPEAAPVKTTTNILELTMNRDVTTEYVNSTDGDNYDLSRYTLYQINGQSADASITIDNVDITNDPSNAIAIGDTITIGSNGSQAAVVFTAVASSPGANEFVVVDGTDATSRNQTATNLAEAINDSDSVDDVYDSFKSYTATATDNTVALQWELPGADINNTTVTASGNGVTTSNFANGTDVSSEKNPTSVDINGATLTFEFDGLIYVGDEFGCTWLMSDEYQRESDGSVGEYSSELYSNEYGNPPLLIVGQDSSSTGTDDASGTAQNFTDYINEHTAADEKTYRRGEVYSLGFAFLYKDGTYSAAYHIPGNETFATNEGEKNANPSWPSYNTTDDTYLLGTYVSTLDYPNGQNYPNGKIRHHYIPELINEPHYGNIGIAATIRKLKLEFEFNTAIPDDILTDVAEIIFLRELRSTNENKSMFAQGIVNRNVITADDFDNDGQVKGTVVSNVKSAYCTTEMSLFNNLEGYRYVGGVSSEGGAKSNSGVAYPNFNNPGYTGTYLDGQKLDTEIKENQCIFHSPESDLETQFKIAGEDITGAFLKSALMLKGTYERLGLYNQNGFSNSVSISSTRKVIYDPVYAWSDYFGNYNDIETSLVSNELRIKNGRTLVENANRHGPIDVSELGHSTSTRWTGGGLELLLDGNVNAEGGTKFEMELAYANRSDRQYNIIDADGPDHESATSGDLERCLYNIETNNAAQYGTIDLASYVPIKRETPQAGTPIYTDVYGGDTVITLYSFKTGALTGNEPIALTENLTSTVSAVNTAKYTQIARPDGYFNTDGIVKNEGGAGFAAGWDLRACTQFFVESSINTYYRHEIDLLNQPFPNNRQLDNLLQTFIPFEGDSKTYNNQYSYENNIIMFYPRSSTDVVIDKFENRTIYSEMAANDDTLDSYRSFLQNDYYDLPAHKGPIWDTFVIYNTLYMHTPKSLWKTFAESAATLSGGNISDVVLGTGDLFARPSQEIMTAEGGYGGTISQFGGTHTEIGYVYPDVLQGKIFGLLVSENGPYLKELSMDGMSSFFREYLPTGLIENNSGDTDLSKVSTDTSHEIDNPFKGIGLCGGYDYELKRFWITKGAVTGLAGVVDNKSFTISFSVLLQKWFSFHSYKPSAYISINDRSLVFDNASYDESDVLGVFEMNLGNKGDFLQPSVDPIIRNSELEIICNTQEYGAKSFQNIIISSDSDLDGIKVRDDNFKSVQVFTDKANTGIILMVPGSTFGQVAASGQVLYKWKNDEYRLTVPRDSVVDHTIDLGVLDNGLVAPNEDDSGDVNIDKTAKFRQRMKGDYSHLRFIYDNNNNRNFVLKLISTIFNKNIR